PLCLRAPWVQIPLPPLSAGGAGTARASARRAPIGAIHLHQDAGQSHTRLHGPRCGRAASTGGERARESEPRIDAVLETRHGADAVASEGKYEEARAVAGAIGSAEVCAERRLTVRSRRDEVESAARLKDAGEELGNDVTALVLKCHRRHRHE